ncbi:NHL repeat protein [Luminiphilus syltensis NOR5-1B]|uniref:NHL repeat protein n=1 Tax=Luminiphilus syltensis NOR5-1B TaxID=565045 RepID=B8KVJ3_9GAMM|nr:beta-propeller fold lactonase family protein [Luminiphilus syltensis]EED34194.1 NHL repeat protein [Luminiphilus syltensis NOR5-1B]
MINRFGSVFIATLALLPGLVQADTPIGVFSERLSDRAPIPTFSVDGAWPRLPSDLIIGQASGVAVDAANTIWVLHRPNSLSASEIGLDKNPPIAQSCCHAAPHVLRFDQDGNLLTAWGGPGLAPEINGINQWPGTVHGLFVDADDTVWLGGNGDDDHVILNFTATGEFIRQFGRRGATEGNISTSTLGKPADVSDNGESILVADGYTNNRIVQLDETDLTHIQNLGAHATEPETRQREDGGALFSESSADYSAEPHSPTFGGVVHCVVRGPGDTVYVCDRRNNRVQVFREAGGKFEFIETIVIAPNSGGTGTATDVAISPDGTYLYIADMMNGKVWILLRETHEILGSFGRIGRYPGQFTWLHSIDVDADGNLYTAEVETGRRVQRFIFQGLEP